MVIKGKIVKAWKNGKRISVKNITAGNKDQLTLEVEYTIPLNDYENSSEKTTIKTVFKLREWLIEG